HFFHPASSGCQDRRDIAKSAIGLCGNTIIDDCSGFGVEWNLTANKDQSIGPNCLRIGANRPGSGICCYHGFHFFLNLELINRYRVTVPRSNSTACPPTLMFVTRSPSRFARTKISLGRPISTPWRISTCSSLFATPYLTIQPEAQPAAEPVAGSSPP